MSASSCWTNLYQSARKARLINSMKRVSILTAILSLFSGCNLFFNHGDLEIAQLNTAIEYENAIDGVYGMLTLAMNDESDFYINVKGDDLFNHGPSYNEFFDSTMIDCKPIFYGSSKYLFNYPWTNLYKVIVSSNNILNQFINIKNAGKEISEIAGEAYLLRAYCYFRLTRTYGEIPLIENLEIDYTVKKSSFLEIYEFIENDLLHAQQLLPERNISARIPSVTPHQGTAKSILAEVYLSWAGYPISDPLKYQLAATTAEEVIDKMDQYGMGLMDDFADIWEKNNLYNKESVFSIYFPLPLDGREYEKNYLFLSSTFRFDTLYNPAYKHFGYWATESKFYNNYPADYRRDITFFNNIYSYEWINNDEGYQMVYTYIDKLNPCSGIGYRKFFYDPTKLSSNSDEPFSRVYYIGNQRLDLFRFAHTVLTYAEAAARSGRLDAKAFECVNMIRRRANHLDIHSPSAFDLQPGLSAEAFADSVVWERAWELAGEPEGRWFDLVRLELVEKIFDFRYHGTGDFPDNEIITKNDYYFSIPKSEIILNPSLGE